MFYRLDTNSRTLRKAKFESACSVHKYFSEGKKNGVLVRLQRNGLAVHDGMEGIT
jgi:hypothetical protein